MGKAKDLKRRLSSYTRFPHLSVKTQQLVQEAVEVKFHELRAELEALLVEAELIRAHQPHYNLLLKDDKSPLYLVITKDLFPQLFTIRKKSLYYTQQKGTIFGPFPSAYKLRQVLHDIRGIFRWCSHPPKRTEIQTSPKPKPCFYYHVGLCGGACIGKVSVEEYREMIEHLKEFLRGKTSLLLHTLKQEMDEYSLEEKYEHAALLRDRIAMIQEITTPKTFRTGPNLEFPQLAIAQQQEMIIQLRRLLSRFLALPATYNFHRIEGYDVSNTQGTKPVVSMVVFTDAQADHNEYKSFNIRLPEKPNDYAMLKEALERRQNHPEWGVPDLLVIDGGRGQLRSAQSVWHWQTPIVSLAKDPDRLYIFKPETQTYIEYPLQDDELVSTLFRRVRDESHRFAKKRHTRRRTVALIQ